MILLHRTADKSFTAFQSVSQLTLLLAKWHISNRMSLISRILAPNPQGLLTEFEIWVSANPKNPGNLPFFQNPGLWPPEVHIIGSD